MILLTKMTISQTKRNEIKNVVICALNHANVPYLPVDVKKICKSYEYIRLIPFSVQMKHRKMTYEEVIAQCQTKDACADYYASKDKYIIYYNDIDKIVFISSNRYRWSIAHELGHILLGHHKISDKTRIFRFNLSDEEYNQFEEEADYFAQLLLVPHAALLGFKIKTSNHLQVMCKISAPASRRRYYEYMEWKSHLSAEDQYDKRVFLYYFNFIFKRKCKNCGAGIVQRYGKFCPICGFKNILEWGDGKMKYRTYDTDLDMKLLECIQCKNEEIPSDGKFCHICGAPTVNKCTNTNDNYSFDNASYCGETLPPNARYCPYCGSRSSFYVAGILPDWSTEQQTIQEAFMSIPEASPDEELPFY